MQQTPAPQYQQPYDPQRAGAERMAEAVAITRRMGRSAERAKSLWMLFTISGGFIAFFGLAVSAMILLIGVGVIIGGMVGYGAANRRVRSAQLEEAKLRAYPWMQ